MSDYAFFNKEFVQPNSVSAQTRFDWWIHFACNNCNNIKPKNHKYALKVLEIHLTVWFLHQYVTEEVFGFTSSNRLCGSWNMGSHSRALQVKINGVAPLVADPSPCNSSTRPNPPDPEKSPLLLIQWSNFIIRIFDVLKWCNNLSIQPKWWGWLGVTYAT